MAATDVPPRFFKEFISHFSSNTMVIPVSYYNHFPSNLSSRTVILQGPSGRWNVAMKYERDELYFAQGWSKFVKDNSLKDGDFLTFVYNGDRVFEVSIYGSSGCKETRGLDKAEDDEKHNSVCSLTSNDTDTSSEVEMVNTAPKLKNKGKNIEEVDDSYDEEDSESDCSYSPEKKVITQKPKKKGSKSKSDDSLELENGKRARKIKAKIKNPEAYLEDPNNVYFETAVKNRKYELLIHGQLVKDYCLKFENFVNYLDNFGELEAKTRTWGDERVCIKNWMKICERNNLKKEDRILCELLRKEGLVYAIKLHIFRGKDL